MLTTSVDGSINIFSVQKNFELINTIKDQDSEINWVEWHPKGPVFAFGTAEGSIWVYMANNTKTNFNFFNHTESCTCGQFFNEGKKLISGGEDAAVASLAKNRGGFHHALEIETVSAHGSWCGAR